MKYLKIHVVIIMSIVLLWALLEFIIIYFFSILWEFKIPKNVWSKYMQSAPERRFLETPVNDKTLWDTLKYRYTYFFD